MLMRPAVRKFVLTAHVTTTVGWLGAAVAYLALILTLLAKHGHPDGERRDSRDEIDRVVCGPSVSAWWPYSPG
jgi:hypothetical protein